MAFKLKSKLSALALVIAAFTGTAAAQDYTFGWNPRSGDVWVDTQLNDVNRYGSRYREPFVDEMVRYYGAPRDLVTELLVTRRWAPGDVYYACSIAHTLGRPCRYVVDEWDRNHEKGWGAVAKDLGIKPGSAEFHRLKRGFVPTYDRWARPIDIDVDLRRDFPNRGKGKSAKASDHGKAHAAHGNAKAGSAKGKAHGSDHGDSGKGKGNSSGDAKGNKGGKGDKGNKGGKG
ncbi:MAG: hypothetical protein ACREPE_08765 [Lysobacter sp.]